MKKWITFIILPTLITYALAFVIDFIFGNSISMNVYCAILGVIYGIAVFVFVPYESLLIATIWLIGSCALDLCVSYNTADDLTGSPFIHNLIKGIVSVITLWLCFIANRENSASPAPSVAPLKASTGIDDEKPTKDIPKQPNMKPSPINEEVIWACGILEINHAQFNRGEVMQAYRNKIKDYHPDKYQSLPEPIQRMLEEKAQQLNNAKDILTQFV